MISSRDCCGAIAKVYAAAQLDDIPPTRRVSAIAVRVNLDFMGTSAFSRSLSGAVAGCGAGPLAVPLWLVIDTRLIWLNPSGSARGHSFFLLRVGSRIDGGRVPQHVGWEAQIRNQTKKVGAGRTARKECASKHG
jgi:hypothetical protein